MNEPAKNEDVGTAFLMVLILIALVIGTSSVDSYRLSKRITALEKELATMKAR